MSDVILYGPPQSSYVRTARMTCGEKGVGHELRPVDFKAPAYREKHPYGKVPAMEHGDVRLFETEAITRYIDDAFDGPPLVPEAPHQRAIMGQWISAINCYMYRNMIVDCALQYLFPRGPDGTPDREVIDRALEKTRHDLSLLDAAYSRTPYIAGPDITLADLFVTPIVATLVRIPEGPGLLDDVPHLRRAYEELVARPTYADIAP